MTFFVQEKGELMLEGQDLEELVFKLLEIGSE